MKWVYLLAWFLARALALDIPYNAGNYEISGDAVYTWRSPDPYPSGGIDLVVTTDHGYMLSITVKNLDIDGASGDLLLVKSGSSLDDGKTGRIFTHHLRSEQTFISLTDDAFFHFVTIGENSAAHSGFDIDIQRFGDAPPTTPPPSNDTTWPTPTDTDSIYLTANISGRRSGDYLNNTEDFREAVANMAREYCTVNNFNLTQAITVENVHLDSITRCPSTWRNNEDCVRIRFSVPVFLYEDRYELTTDHLDVMWNTLSDRYLSEIGLMNYVLVDPGHIVLMWLIAICLIIISFGFVIYITRLIAFKRIKASKKQRDITHLYDEKEEKKRPSGDSLAPHPLQTVPNLFEKEFSFYEPDLSPTPYASGISETDLDLQQFTFVEKERTASSEI